MIDVIPASRDIAADLFYTGRNAGCPDPETAAGRWQTGNFNGKLY